MKVIALTGGIGSGKSTVAQMMAALGAGVVRLDDVGHYVLTLPEVKYDLGRTFGMGIFNAKGEVVRPALAAAAFDTPEHTAWLNAVTHPAIEHERKRRVAELGKLHDAVVVEVSVGGASRAELPWADAVVTVTAPADLRVQRACARGNQTEADVLARMAAQATDEQRVAAADHVIENAATEAALRTRVAEVWDAFSAPEYDV